MLASAVSAALAPAAQAAPADDARGLLERHRPVLRYAAQEQFFAQLVSLPPGTAEVRMGERVYGRLVRDDDQTWLQYWLFYADNPQDRSPLGTGRHEGDWELVQVGLGPDDRPRHATFSQHSWAERCAWDEVDNQGPAPVVYVANGSHANYSRPGHHGRPFPDPTDEATGDGDRVRPALSVIDDESPAWVSYPGRWGDTEAGWVPGESSSPYGPRFQESDAWDDPSGYAERARECGSGAPGRPWQTAAVVAVPVLVLVLGGAALIAVRRARRGATA